MPKFNELRAANNIFIYHNYDLIQDANTISLVFTYKLVEQEKETVFDHILKLNISDQITIHKNLDNIIFHIGLIEAINYWKIAAAKTFKIQCGFLSNDQMLWFKKLYYHGLGEFLYLNDIAINLDDLLEFIVENNKKPFSPIQVDTIENNIIPIGGGKDSLVTYEILKKQFPKSYMFSMNPIQASQTILKDHPKSSIVLSRILDKKILKFNKKGYLNGHIPFSSIVAFISIWLGLIYKTKYIVLSNESSANEENVTFNDLKVNHQYSKSIEFENDFRNYIRKYITKDVEYFSFLRPLDELHIARLFSKNCKKHFFTFRSCNVGSRENEWCGSCPKCLFTYIMLCNFIEDEILQKIFGKDMLDDQELLTIFNQLSLDEEVKPFECVGTYDEVNYAISNKIKQYSKKPLPYLLERYKKNNLSGYDFVVDFETGHNLPDTYKKILKENVEKLNSRAQ